MDERAGLPDDWWLVDDCAQYLGIAAGTWTAYVSREQAPQPDRMFGRSPAWRPATIQAWHDSRPRKGKESQ